MKLFMGEDANILWMVQSLWSRADRPNLVHQAIEKEKENQEWLKTSQSRQKSYTDAPLEFEVDNWVSESLTPGMFYEFL